MKLFKMFSQDYMDMYPHPYYFVGTEESLKEYIYHMNHSGWSGRVWLDKEIPFSTSFRWTREFWNNLMKEGDLLILLMEKYLPDYKEEFKEFCDSLKESKSRRELLPKSQLDYWGIFCLNKAHLYLPQSMLTWKRR